MKRYAICLLLAVSLTLGCSSYHMVRLDNPNKAAQLNERVYDRIVQVTLMDGRVFEALHLRVDPDSTAWDAPVTGERKRVASHNLAEVHFVSRGSGAAQGFVAGAGIGAALGVFSFAQVSGSFGDAEAPPALAVLGMGIFTGAFGAVVGALKGNHQRYVIEQVQRPQGQSKTARSRKTEPGR